MHSHKKRRTLIIKAPSWAGHSRAWCTRWLPAGDPQPRLGCGARQPPHTPYQPLGLMQRGWGQAGREHCTPGEFPQRNPFREQRCHQKGFFDPRWRRRDHGRLAFTAKGKPCSPGSRARPRLCLGVTLEFTHIPNRAPHLPRRPDRDGSSGAESSALSGLRDCGSGRTLSGCGMKRQPTRVQGSALTPLPGRATCCLPTPREAPARPAPTCRTPAS